MINLIKRSKKNHFLLLKKKKNTESAQLCSCVENTARSRFCRGAKVARSRARVTSLTTFFFFSFPKKTMREDVTRGLTFSFPTSSAHFHYPEDRNSIGNASSLSTRPCYELHLRSVAVDSAIVITGLIIYHQPFLYHTMNVPSFLPVVVQRLVKLNI